MSSICSPYQHTPAYRRIKSKALTCNEATNLGKMLLRIHDLHDWDCIFTQMRNRYRGNHPANIFLNTKLGECSDDLKCIFIDYSVLSTRSKTSVTNLILHEIAHALTPGEGHTRRWRRKALEIGVHRRDVRPYLGRMDALLDEVQQRIDTYKAGK